MNRSIDGVITFLRDNDSVIKQLMETAESATNDIEQLATSVGHARDEAQVLVDQLGAVEFSVGRDDETKVRQTALLEAVAALRKNSSATKTILYEGASTQPRSPISICNWRTRLITRPSPGSFPSAPTKSRPTKT